jgi:hypothetical protein
MSDQQKSEAPVDYDGLMQANLKRVFSERDASRRMEVIRELYAKDAVLHEPHASATGHTAISQAWKPYYRACRQTSSSQRSAPPSGTMVSDGCVGSPVHRTVPWS